MKRPQAPGRYHILAGRAARGATPGAVPPVTRAACAPLSPIRPDTDPVAAGARRRPKMIGEDVMVPSSEADQLRQQLLQAQKLSSVGALASSVAHEFNNILTTIINYARLALRSGGDDLARTQALEKILKGSQR